jgi:excisionase family DNA binding protein
MQAVTITQITPPELETLIESSLKKVLRTQQTEPPKQTDQSFDLEGLEAYLRLARATLYGKLANGEVPGHKRGKKWYFLRSEIDDYLRQGRRKTLAETEAEADAYLNERKKKGGCHD